MFLAGESYFKEVQNLIHSNAHIDLAVAFWGKGSDSLLSVEGKTARVVCQLRGGGTNPAPIRQLIKSGGVQVRALDILHAKVVLGASTAIVGSANCSTNGLGYEVGQNSGWSEAGILVHDIGDIAAAKSWFEATWSEAKEINEAMLVEAEEEWKKRQRGKKHGPDIGSILELTAADLENSGIYVCVSSEDVSNKAKTLNNQYCADNTNITPSDYVIEPFTNWKSMGMGQEIISVFIGPMGGIKDVSGPYKVIATGQFEEDGEQQTIYHALLSQDEILAGLPFGSKQLSALNDAIKKDTLGTINNQDIVPIGEFFAKYTNLFD